MKQEIEIEMIIDREVVKSDLALQDDLMRFRDYIKNYKGRPSLYEIQEYVLTDLYLLINPTFRSKAQQIREEYQIPSQFYKDHNRSGFEDWLRIQRREVPYEIDAQEITEISFSCNVNPFEHGYFVLNYVFFGDVSISLPSDIDYLSSNEQYRYKSRIVLNNGEYLGIREQPAAYIQFYKNTEPSLIIEFVKRNKTLINNLRNELRPFPHTKKFENIGRDIQIYILNLLGNSPVEVANKLDKENQPHASENNMDRIIKDIETFMLSKSGNKNP